MGNVTQYIYDWPQSGQQVPTKFVLANDYAELDARFNGLQRGYTRVVAYYDKHEGTPCEQIRHQQEIETLEAKLAEVTKERDKYHMDALVKFDCQVCSGALEKENSQLGVNCRWAMGMVAQTEQWSAEMFNGDGDPGVAKELLENPKYQRAVTWLKAHPQEEE